VSNRTGDRDSSDSRRASNRFAGTGSIAARSSVKSVATAPGFPRVVRS